MKKITFLFLFMMVTVLASAQSVFINEIHYDNTGADVGEAVEIAGPAGTDLTGWTIVKYNGNGGATYDTPIALSGVIDDEGATGYGALNFAANASGLQNGGSDPDGIALVDDLGNVVQFLSYEGSFTATNGVANGMTSSDIGVLEVGSEATGMSLQLTGSGDDYGDFTWNAPVADSFGDINAGQTFLAPPPPPVGLFTDCAMDNPQPIQDFMTVTSEVEVTASGTIGAMTDEYVFDQVLANLQHNKAGDLVFTLTSPEGTVFDLSSNNGGNDGLDNPGQDFILRDDSANGNVTTWTGAPTAADYVAEDGDLNTAFDGEDINGIWTLTVADGGLGGQGNLRDFCLSFIANGVVGTPPVISCPGNIMADADDGECSAVVSYGAPFAFDAEDTPNPTPVLVSGPETASGMIFPVGDTTVEYEVTDSDGNMDTCSFIVTVSDTQNPEAMCVGSITVELDAVTGMVSITPDMIDDGSMDNCGIDTYTLDIDTFDCSNLGDNTVVLTVTDDAGNMDTCTATVVVEDNTAPVITCQGAGVTVTEDFNAGLPASWTTTLTGTCGEWLNDTVLPTGAPFSTPGMIINDDDCGSTAPPNVAELISAVYDMTGSTEATLTYDVYFQESGDQELSVEVYDGTAWQEIILYDADLTEQVKSESFDVSAFINPDFQVRYTYDDLGGWGWGAGIDNFSLEYDSPLATPYPVTLGPDGTATFPALNLIDGATDNCDFTVTIGGLDSTPQSLTTTYTQNPTIFSTVGGYMFDVMAVNDITVNTFDINLYSDPANGSTDVEVYYKSGTFVGSETTPADWTLIGTATGITSNGNLVPTPLNLNLGQFIPAGETGAFYVTTTDGDEVIYSNNGNNVGDLQASDSNLEIYEGVANLYPFASPSPFALAFNGTIDYFEGTPPNTDVTFDCSNLGESEIEVTVTDDSGNSATCMATVVVSDVTAPVIVCQDTDVELGEDGTTTIDPYALLAQNPDTFEAMVIGSDIDDGSFSSGTTDFTVDVTADVTVSFDWDFTSDDTLSGFDSFGYLINGTYTQLTDDGTLTQSGSATVALVAGDEFGFRSVSDDNTGGGTSTVVRNFVPGFNGQFAPANWTETLDNSDGEAFFVTIPGGPMAYDACGIDTILTDVTEVSCADIGTPITVTIFASDASGNITSCTTVINVVDTMAPVLTCPGDQMVDSDDNTGTYTLPDYFDTGDATATDNCTDDASVTTTQDPAPGTELGVGDTNTVTLTATDAEGNVSTCTFNVEVQFLGVQDNALENAISMYPNPASSQVTIANRSNIALEQAMIYDVNGKLVNQINLSTMQGEKVIDVSALSTGVYMVRIIGEQASVVKRLIKK